MPIDLSKVQWDDEAPAQAGQIDLSKVQWDEPAPKPDNSARQWGKVTTGALAPYATAAALGGGAGLIGGPLAEVTVPAGAAGGVLSLGLADLGTYGVNAISSLFGGPQFQQPSDTIRQKYIDVGLAAEPQTATQRVASDVLGAAAGGGSQALGFGLLKNAPRSQTMRNVMALMADAPGMQTAASAGGAAAPSVAANYMGVKDPAVLMALGYGGSMAAGHKFTPGKVNYTPDEHIARGRASYDDLAAQGVKFTGPALKAISNDISQTLVKEGFDPALEPEVAVWLGKVDKTAKGPLDFKKLDKYHSKIAEDARVAARNGHDDTARLLGILADKVDDALSDVQPNQTTARNVATASATLTEARKAWRQGKRAEIINGVFARAKDKVEQSGTSTSRHTIDEGEALRQEFAALMKNKREWGRFTPKEQDYIREVANGTPGRRALASLGSFAPDSLRKVGAEAGVPLMGAYALGAHPALGLAIGGTMMGLGSAAKGQANKAGIRAADRARDAVSGVKTPANAMLPLRTFLGVRAAIEADAKARRNRSQSRR